LNQPSDKIKRDINKIASTAPENPWVSAQKQVEISFDVAAKKFVVN